MSIAEVLAHLPVAGRKAADVSKPVRAVRATGKRAALRTFVAVSPESDKKCESDKVYAASRRRVLAAAKNKCQVKLPGCQRNAFETHHLKRRSQAKDHSEGNLVAICGSCHRYVENHPAEAYAAGWLVKSWMPVAGREGSGLTKGTNK